MDASDLFAKEKIKKILIKIAPPVMFAQLIQALYNIVDSLFVGKYSESGLTALSIIYPLQLLMIALAVGTGVGINTIISAKLGEGKEEEAEEYAGIGTLLAAIIWIFFAILGYFFMPAYARMSTNSEIIIKDIITYGREVCIFSFGLVFESIWTKNLQAYGNMKTPMIAQIVGAVVNIILDPLLIFGLYGFPRLGILGAAIATVFGQIIAAIIVFKDGFKKLPEKSKFFHHTCQIYKLGIPNILMQSAYTYYILGLNLILATFSDQAVTTLGIYYKWQTFFFIPLGAMQTCIVPIISFNYAANNMARCRVTLKDANIFGFIFMGLGGLCFIFIPCQMLGVFSSDNLVIEIGRTAFPIIGLSFIPIVTSLIFPVFFQAVGMSMISSILTLLRTLILFVPLGYCFSKFGLDIFWLTFPITETITSLVGYYFYCRFLQNDLHERIETLKDGKQIKVIRF